MRRKLLTIAEFVFILGILFVLGFFTYLYLEQPWRNLTASATQQTLGLSLDIASQNNNNQGENQGGGGGGGGGGGVTTVPGSSAVTPIIVPASTVYTFGTFNLPQLFASIAPTGKLSFVLFLSLFALLFLYHLYLLALPRQRAFVPSRFPQTRPSPSPVQSRSIQNKLALLEESYRSGLITKKSYLRDKQALVEVLRKRP